MACPGEASSVGTREILEKERCEYLWEEEHCAWSLEETEWFEKPSLCSN